MQRRLGDVDVAHAMAANRKAAEREEDAEEDGERKPCPDAQAGVRREQYLVER